MRGEIHHAKRHGSVRHGEGNWVPGRVSCRVRKVNPYILCLFHDGLSFPECRITAKLLIGRRFLPLFYTWPQGGGGLLETQYIGVAAQDQYKL